MNITQIDNNIKTLVKNYNQSTFIYDLLLAYGLPKASIKRLQTGSLNLSRISGEICWKKKLFFKEVKTEELYTAIDTIKSNYNSIKNNPRFLIVTDYKRLLAIDVKNQDSLDIELADIEKHYAFFLPWAGMEKAQLKLENPADVKAAEKMAKLFDEIKKENTNTTPDEIHNLNIFLSRLLFCLFAEDTGIFPIKGQFTQGIESYTQKDGSDLHTYLDNLFLVLNLPDRLRSNLPGYFSSFPYVNGGLFYGVQYTAPFFSRKSRQILIECGSLDWSAINPDIFGSMIQAVVSSEHRGSMGMHYTSVPNIMKVIEPLFLNDLYEDFEASKNEPRKLQLLLNRIAKIKLFDPACGSGNFLIIAYKELRQLEIKILQQFQLLKSAATGYVPKQLELIPKAQVSLAAQYQHSFFSVIELQNFYGIELDDFAHEIAILSLWLAQHQMNQAFKEVFGAVNPLLPLQPSGNIIHGNATRLDWEEVCPKKEGDEIYILGNPPYLGSRRQDDDQKEDLKTIFESDYKSIDYISAWFYKGAKYIKGINSKYAFVSTNSICQGEQVSLLWKRILSKDIEIGFAHRDFKWSNSAKNNAAVIVVIVGVQNKSKDNKVIFSNNIKTVVSTINPYLVEGEIVYVESRQKPLAHFPEMNFGNMPADGGKLLFTTEEKNKFISDEPLSEKYFKKLISAYEFLNGLERWCLWLEGCTEQEINSMKLVKSRVDQLKQIRKNSSRPYLASIPHLFAQITQPTNKEFILIPRHSSENRKYIPMGLFNSDNKAHDSCLIIPTNNAYLFGILTSLMHMVWTKSVAGRIKSDFRYSKDIVYNNFPFPLITAHQKQELDKFTYRVLEEREKHPEKTLAQLYDPRKMPGGLREAHHQLDLSVEQCYRSKPFETDEERIEYLFKLYEQMMAEEKDKGTLFEINTKSKKIKKKLNA